MITGSSIPMCFINRATLFIITIIALFCLVLPIGKTTDRFVCILMLSLSFTPIVISWKQKDATFLIIYLYMAMYALPPIQYCFLGEDISQWRTQCQSQVTVYQTMLTVIIFYLGIIWGQYKSGYKKRNNVYVHILRTNNNYIGYILCIIIAIICIIFGKSGDTIIASGGYGQSENVVHNSLYGYGVIPLLIGLQFSNSIFKRYIIFALCGIYMVKDLLYGGRIDSIQLCIGLYLLYFRFKWTLKKTILIACLGFVIMTIWGIFRAAIDRGIVFAYERFIGNIGGDGNSNEVFYSSMRIIYFIENGILTLSDRIESFIYFIESIFVPSSWLPDIANLSSWNQQIASSGGGGLFPVYMMAMCGWGGLFIAAFIIGIAFRKFQDAKGSNFFTFWAILVVTTVPRWYAYYPISLFKFALFGSLLYVILNRFFPRTKI